MHISKFTIYFICCCLFPAALPVIIDLFYALISETLAVPLYLCITKYGTEMVIAERVRVCMKIIVIEFEAFILLHTSLA